MSTAKHRSHPIVLNFAPITCQHDTRLAYCLLTFRPEPQQREAKRTD